MECVTDEKSECDSVTKIMEGYQMLQKANRVLKVISEKNLNKFSRRDVMRWCQEFKCVGEIQPVLDFLEASSDIIAVKAEPEYYNGRPPMHKYILNPQIAVSEKTIEQELVKAVKAMGGIAPKFTSPGFDGMPDRIIILPDGKMGFVEVKAPGKKPRPLQEARHNLLRQMGCKVYVIDGAEQIQSVLVEIGEEA